MKFRLGQRNFTACWLSLLYFGEGIELDKIASLMAFVSALLIFASQFITIRQTFDYSVRVVSRGTAQEVPYADVTVEVAGRPNLNGVTDVNGLVTITIPSSYARQRGRLIVEASGHKRHFEELILEEGMLTDIVTLEVVQAEPVSDTSIPTPPITPTSSDPTNTLATEPPATFESRPTLTTTRESEVEAEFSEATEIMNQQPQQDVTIPPFRLPTLDKAMEGLSNSARLILLAAFGIASILISMTLASYFANSLKTYGPNVKNVGRILIFFSSTVVSLLLMDTKGWHISSAILVGLVVWGAKAMLIDLYSRLAYAMTGMVVGACLVVGCILFYLAYYTIFESQLLISGLVAGGVLGLVLGFVLGKND